ncbi:MAG: DUF2809 domain-containing protein [Sarcina sp.]
MNKKYSVLFLATFFIEVFIALFVKDNFIRPYIGDVLVILCIYFFIRSFTNKKIKNLPIYIFIFSIIVELLQGINILGILGLENIKFMRVLVGTTFDFKDIVCYFIGTMVLVVWSYSENNKFFSN